MSASLGEDGSRGRLTPVRGPLFGIALKIAATFAFGLMGLVVKTLGDRYPVGQLIAFRAAFALLPVLALLFLRGGSFADLATKRPGAHALRAGAGTAGMFFGFTALTLLPLADATAISFASPIITVALAVLMLGEKVRLYRWIAAAAGFTGVMMMVWPHLQAGQEAPRSAFGAGAALTGAVFSAFAMIFIRRMSVPGERQESGEVIAFYFQLCAALFAGATLFFAWRTPTPADLGLLVLSGLLGGMGQLLMTHSYAYAPASTIATFDYVAMIWALLFGWLFFGEWPEALVLTGAAVVIGAGVFIIRREHRLTLDAARGAARD